MRKIISIIALSIFLTHLAGFYIYFVVRQAQIHQEMRQEIASLPADEFEIFELSIEEYQKIKVNNHEVKIDGKMYDHSAPKLENGKIILYAKHDQAEDNLISFLSEVVNIASHDNKPAPSTLMSYLTLQFISAGILEMFFFNESINFMDNFQVNLVSKDYPVDAPPPKG
ncbi:MAG TPA: hypothetical protein VIS49_10675 [Cyclobacteriaceae bacterium]